MSEKIELRDDTYATLVELKGQDESFDELLLALVEERERVLNGAGLWEDSDAAAHARVAREEMRSAME